MKYLLLIAVLVTVTPSLSAAGKPPPVPCWKVIGYVALYGKDAVESWARDQGYSEADIAATRHRCKI